MGRVRVEWDGLDQLVRGLASTPEVGGKVIAQAINAEMQEVFRASQRQVPYQYGALRASGRPEPGRVEGNTITAEITYGSTAAEYALHVHEGTQPHVIRPKNGKALKFKIGNRVVFASSVNHPGTTGKPYLRKPVEDAAPHMGTRIAKRLEAMLKRLG